MTPIELRVRGCWSLVPGAAVILAEGPVSLPASFEASVPTLAPGPCLSFSWGKTFHLLALRIEGVKTFEQTPLLLHSGQHTPLAMLKIPQETDALGFSNMLASNGMAASGDILNFLMHAFQAETIATFPDAGRMLRSFLTQVAKPTGYIELITSVAESGVFLQGWGAPLDPHADVIIPTADMPRFKVQTTSFVRQDIKDPSIGMIMAFPPGAIQSLTHADHVFVVSSSGIQHWEIAQHPVLSGDNARGNLQHLMQTYLTKTAKTNPAVQKQILDALRPRYTGHNTLRADVAVRVAIDFGAFHPKVGLYLAGWVYDPTESVVMIKACIQQHHITLTNRWVTISRPDVRDAFEHEPWPKPRHTNHGFAVFAPFPVDAAHDAHLEVRLADGTVAFVPLTLAMAEHADVRSQLLNSVDLHKPSGMDIVERHLAPFVAAIRLNPSAHQWSLNASLDQRHAIVVPLLQEPESVRAFLSQFLLDPCTDDEILVFVLGPSWTPAARDALVRLVAFYQLPATFLTSSVPVSLPAVLRTLADQGAATLLLTSCHTVGVQPGWRRQLRATTPPDSIGCPTLLYEDWSIRFAGADAPITSLHPPYAEWGGDLTGLPALALQADQPVPVSIGSLQACLIPASIAQELRTSIPAMSSIEGQEAAFFLSLMAQNIPVYWIPTVTLYAPEVLGGTNHADRVGRLVDGWIVRSLCPPPVAPPVSALPVPSNPVHSSRSVRAIARGAASSSGKA